MKNLLLALGSATLALGCTNLNEGKSLTEEVTSQPSPAFMKKVAGDPFPVAGSPIRQAQSTAGPNVPATRLGMASVGNTAPTQRGLPTFPTTSPPTTSPSGTASKKVTGKP